MNNYIEFILFLTVVALVGFFVLVFTSLERQNKRMQTALEEDERERKQLANEKFKQDVVRSLTADARMQQDIQQAHTAELGDQPHEASKQTTMNANGINESQFLHDTSLHEVEVYQSRAERRKQGERGSLQLKATLSKKGCEQYDINATTFNKHV